MAALGASAASTTPDTLITIKVAIDGSNRKFKLPLRDLTIASFNEKIRSVLAIPANQRILIERFSDSSASFIALDVKNPSSYKQLYRAGKAKLKLRLRVTLLDPAPKKTEAEKSQEGPMLPHITNLVNQTNAATSSPDRSSNASLGTSLGYSTARAQYFDQLANITREREMGRRMKEAPTPQMPSTCWQVCCNACDKQMADSHFHCSTCDNGDYDLCEGCVNSGITCPGNGHWLIKRFIKNGSVVNSTTERIAPKAYQKKDVVAEMPGTDVTEVKTEISKPEPRRTCNSCVRALPEKLLVTCVDCDDYDLCVPCLTDNKHGHHPGHTFKAISDELSITSHTAALCSPGRYVYHDAICDGCDKSIIGVRHKCLQCPDWDFCSECYKSAPQTHGRHRFAPIYEPLTTPSSSSYGRMNLGVLCDGPLCKSRTNSRGYIRGIRYKCTICDDVDFCANCEAHPDRGSQCWGHPLIKMRMPIRHVQIDVKGDHGFRNVNQELRRLSADRAASQSLASQQPTLQVPGSQDDSNNTEPSTSEKTENPTPMIDLTGPDLDAHFVSDAIADGTSIPPDTRFEQTWKVINPGPHAWPVGCSVCHVGGDSMLDIDYTRPASVQDLASAKASNFNLNVVAKGQIYDWSVVMRTPIRSGKHISYWRLKAPDGTPFGHKLWCDIEVNDIEIHPSKSEEEAKGIEEPENKINAKLPNQLNSSAKAAYDYQVSLLGMQNVEKLRALHVQDLESNGDEKPLRGHNAFYGFDAAPLASSGMVFPTLEKESPASSMTVEAGVPGVQKTQWTPLLQDEVLLKQIAKTESETPTLASPEAKEPGFENVDFSVSSDDEDDDEDGFLTDEEYDILDASDEEIVNASGPSA